MIENFDSEYREKLETIVNDIRRRNKIFDGITEKILSILELFNILAIQFISDDNLSIETVYGKGIPREWTDFAKQFIASNQKIIDIHADIVHSLNTEIIEGYDRRFDPWLYEKLGHSKLRRIFTPIVIVKDRQSGRIVDDWYVNISFSFSKFYEDESSKKLVIRFPVNDLYSQKYSVECIGTIEIGAVIDNFSESITSDLIIKKARQLIRLVANFSCKLRQLRFVYLLEFLTDNIVSRYNIDSCSMHYSFDYKRHRYIYEACAGKRIDRDFLTSFPTRRSGIGRKAVLEKSIKIVDDFEKLKEDNPEIYNYGIKSIAAIPITTGDDEGVLYLHYHDTRKFDRDSIQNLKDILMRVAFYITSLEDITKLNISFNHLNSLIYAVPRITSEINTENLLKQIGWCILKIVTADIVTIYQFDQENNCFYNTPIVAGRLITSPYKLTLDTKINRGLKNLVDEHDEIFAESLSDDVVLLNTMKEHKTSILSFLFSENVCSSTTITLKYCDQLLGVIFINYRRHCLFDNYHKELMRSVCKVASNAIRFSTLINADKYRDCNK